MRDLIDRQASIETIMSDKIDDNTLNIMIALGSGKEAKTLNDACDRHASLLNDLPSAQPEMIRCKECKFSHMTSDGRYCKYCDQFTDTDDYGELVEMYFDSDFYCGYAERRTE